MTADKTRGNFCGSFIDSVIGMTLFGINLEHRAPTVTHKPIPSNANAAVPMRSGNEFLLNMATSARPSVAKTWVSLIPM
jgi:hypothetical protein